MENTLSLIMLVCTLKFHIINLLSSLVCLGYGFSQDIVINSVSHVAIVHMETYFYIQSNLDTHICTFCLLHLWVDAELHLISQSSIDNKVRSHLKSYFHLLYFMV